jgi:serine protease
MRSSAAVPTWLLAAARRALGRHPPLLLVLTALATAAVFVQAQEHNPVLTRPAAADAPTQRLIVKLRGTTPRVSAQASDDRESLSASEHASRVAALATRLHYTVDSSRALGGNLYALDISPLEGSETQDQTLALLSADEEVEFAVPDRRVYAYAVPNDPIANISPNGQWYLRNVEPSAINANAAWDVTRGSNGVVIAFVDTGVRFEHPDIQRTDRGGRLLAGYDFVSADRGDTFVTANDEDGRDLDAADPGDYCGQGSSWHGTRVAGILGALTNNGIGVAGVTWSSYLLPVRVLGRCGGYTSDVLAGLRWAAGLEVPGVLPTPTPAQIINVSLGARGTCDAASAETIAEITAAGVLVVVAAGNEGREVESPANCPGALAVVGLRHSGTKVGFSSLGREVALGAPAGNCVNTGPNVPCVYTIDTTINLGLNVPTTDDYTNDLRPNTGTSFSAPIVSGIAGLMLAANGNLRSRQLFARLQSGAKPFPATSGLPICRVPAGDVQGSECACTQETCGAGMANAANSVNEALRPIAAISVPAAVSPGETITLEGGGSGASCNAAIAGYAWSVVSGSAALTNASTANASLQVPSAEPVRIRLMVTDNAGRTDSTHVTVNPTSVAVEGPTNAGSTACLPPRSPPPFVTVTATDDTAEEGAAGDTGTFSVTRSGSTTNAITVGIKYLGTAAVGSDYQALPSSVTFAAGATSATLTVTPLDDDAGETPETLTASLQMGTGYSVASQSKATVAMNDDDYQEITVFAQDSFASEENAETGSFVVNRTGNTTRPLTVGLSYAGTATSGSDYQALPASVTFAVGSKSTSFVMTPIDDALPDNAETVAVIVMPAPNYVVHPGNGRAMISIRDAETPQMSIVASDGTASEQGPEGGAFVVRRTGPSGTPVTVNLETVGTATAGADYQAIPATVSMAAGQTEVSLTLTPIDDAVAEEQETVIASLAAGTGYDLGIEASAIVRISDNDGASQQAPGTTARSNGNGGGGVLDLLTVLLVLGFALRAGRKMPSIAGRLRVRALNRRAARSENA